MQGSFSSSSVIASFDALESRRLLSNSGSSQDGATSDADRSKVDASLATLMVHLDANKAAVAAAKAELLADREAHVDAVKPMKKALKANEKALRAEWDKLKESRAEVDAKWSDILAADKADVAVVEETETLEEQAADKAKLEADLAAYKSERGEVDKEWRADKRRIEAQIKLNRQAFKTAEDAAKAEVKASEKAVKRAERTLKDVFQSDRKIVDAAIKAYKKDGGDVKALDLPNLSKLLK